MLPDESFLSDIDKTKKSFYDSKVSYVNKHCDNRNQMISYPVYDSIVNF
jgi:hypothetical protein